MIFVNDGERGIMQFLRIALRLCQHCERKLIDHEREEHPIAKEAAKLLGTEPENVGGHAHSSLFLLAKQKETKRRERWDEYGQGCNMPTQISKTETFSECSNADGDKVGHRKKAADDRPQSGD